MVTSKLFKLDKVVIQEETISTKMVIDVIQHALHTCYYNVPTYTR